jgi:sec-independent protein translocase protein TatC
MAQVEEDQVEQSRAPLIEHLVELRSRLMVLVVALLVAFVGCFFAAEIIYGWLLLPYQSAAAAARNIPIEELELTANFFAPMEFFFVKLQLAFIGAIMVIFPLIAWQIYGFVAPGLYNNEKGAFAPFLVLSPMLFAGGVSFVYYMVLPMVMRFSLGQEQVSELAGVSIELLLNVSHYMNLVTLLMLVFGLSFQMPILMMLLAKAGIVRSTTMLAGWRYAVVGIALFAAFATPPDPISQLLLGTAMLLLYFISIGGMKMMEPKPDDTDSSDE